MADRTTGLTSLRECLAKSRGVFPQPCVGCELSEMEVPINAYQTDTDLVIQAFLPGVKLEEIKTSITPDIISIEGEHRESAPVREEDYFCREHGSGVFARKLATPFPVQSERASINLESGVLTLTLPKAGGSG